MASKVNPAEREVLYLYGVTSSILPDPVREPGVDFKSAVLPFECGGIVCWVSRVSAAEFESNLGRNMENLDWLAPAGVAHQRTIEAIARRAEILPARFGTVFKSEASLRRHVRQHMTELKKNFDRVKGADEWGVKVFAVSAPVPDITEVRTGRDYLRAKAAARPRTGKDESARSELDQFARALESVAEEVLPAAGNVSRGQKGLAFQTSLLVKRNRQKRLKSLLEEYSRRWAHQRRVECSGPWPPYSFVSRDTEGERSI